jgi:aminoglycoside phosphotransferase (APT) family kinase protein
LSNPFDVETLTELTLAHVDADPGSLRCAPVRTGKHNASFWVDSDQGRFVLRIAPPDDAGFLFYERQMMRQEPALHALVRARTDIPVARIVGYDLERSRIDRDYLLMTALPGTPLSDAPGLDRARFNRALEQVGRCLRQLHGSVTYSVH